MNDTLEHLLRTGADERTGAGRARPAGRSPTAACARWSPRRSPRSTRPASGRNDRVAIVLDNGPEMAACFLACAAGATSAPLNPAYRAEEFEFYLTDLNAKAADRRARRATSPAIEVARAARRPRSST